MLKYKISKIGRNGENNSYFGDIQEFFEGVSASEPIIGERFELFHETMGFMVISTSPVLEIEENLIKTTYSIYSIEKM